MRLTRFFILGLMLAYAGITHADDILKVQDVELIPGDSITLNIELSNGTTNLMGFQCDINLPEGLSLKLKTNGKPAATLGERFATTEHAISSNLLTNGTYRFIATSMEGEAIPDTKGTLFSVTLQADPSLVPGTQLQGIVKKIEFNTQDNEKLTFDDVSFNITINEKPLTAKLGDVNHDEAIDVTDAVLIIDHILMKTPQGFDASVADVNGDGGIDVTDVVMVIDVILGKIKL